MTTRSQFSTSLAAALAAWTIAGCAGDPPESATDQEDPPLAVAPVDTVEPQITPAELRRKLGVNANAEILQSGGRIRRVSLMHQSHVSDLSPLEGLPLTYLDLTGTSVADLSPLVGMPLEELYLEDTQVRDLRPLKGMPLRILRMEHAPVGDISPLEGMPLEQLNLYGTDVTDIRAVAGMPLNTLWLTETDVSDLSPLEGQRLESLDVQGTPVEDLRALRGMRSLRRLNIAESRVSDLTPLAGLTLERLIFTPDRIKTGLGVVRSMPSLQQIGTSFETTQSAAQFWEEFDSR